MQSNNQTVHLFLEDPINYRSWYMTLWKQMSKTAFILCKEEYMENTRRGWSRVIALWCSIMQPCKHYSRCYGSFNSHQSSMLYSEEAMYKCGMDLKSILQNIKRYDCWINSTLSQDKIMMSDQQPPLAKY